jgi:tetratricopeptide (TPR) repeat protein
VKRTSLARIALVALVPGALAPGALAFAPDAFADTPPSRWETAKEPRARELYDVHVQARRLIVGDSRQEAGDEVAHERDLDRARILLEQAGAERSPDVRLRFDLGEVYHGLKRQERAIAVLRPALAEHPNHPAALEAMLILATAYAKLDRSAEERDAYRWYLARVTDDRARTNVLLNLAEAEMHLGNIDEAVLTYRETLQLTNELPNTPSVLETGILAVWGLAVALDRSGDPYGALEQARLATRLDQEERLIGKGANVFFVPEYERDWYLALAATVHAREEKKPREALKHWLNAEAHWDTYVTQGTRNGDRWLAIARRHRDQVRVQRVAVEKRVATLPPEGREAIQPNQPLPPY